MVLAEQAGHLPPAGRIISLGETRVALLLAHIDRLYECCLVRLSLVGYGLDNFCSLNAFGAFA